MNWQFFLGVTMFSAASENARPLSSQILQPSHDLKSRSAQ
jgi:hypothetical protein